eukprot:s345_g11.t1
MSVAVADGLIKVELAASACKKSGKSEAKETWLYCPEGGSSGHVQSVLRSVVAGRFLPPLHGSTLPSDCTGEG